MEKSGTKRKINPIKSTGGITGALLQAGGRRFETCSAYIKNIKGLGDNLKPFFMSKILIPHIENQICNRFSSLKIEPIWTPKTGMMDT